MPWEREKKTRCTVCAFALSDRLLDSDDHLSVVTALSQLSVHALSQNPALRAFCEGAISSCFLMRLGVRTRLVVKSLPDEMISSLKDGKSSREDTRSMRVGKSIHDKHGVIAPCSQYK